MLYISGMYNTYNINGSTYSSSGTYSISYTYKYISSRLYWYIGKQRYLLTVSLGNDALNVEGTTDILRLVIMKKRLEKLAPSTVLPKSKLPYKCIVFYLSSFKLDTKN